MKENKRKFITATMKVKYEDEPLELELKTNLTDDEMDQAISLWVSNTDDRSEESLCDFIHLLDTEYIAYSRQDAKYLTWMINCNIDAEC